MLFYRSCSYDLRLFDEDSHLREFDAVVRSCAPGKNGVYLVVLDRTAFFPEAGGLRLPIHLGRLFFGDTKPRFY